MSIIVVVGCNANGATGSHGLQYNNISRYPAITTPGEEVWITSSADVYATLPWNRTGTSLTLTKFNHGLSVGNIVIVRYANVEMVSGPITARTADTFTISTPNTGDASGTTAIYSCGFSYTHSSNPKTGGVLALPSGSNKDIQILSMRIRTGLRAGTTYDVVVPTSIFNNFGRNTFLGDSYIPSYSVRQDVDFLSAVGATINTNIEGSYATLRFSNLGLGNQSRYIILDF